MNLVLDVGNTKIKYALFNDSEMIIQGLMDWNNYQHQIDEILLKNKNTLSVSISTVVEFNDDVNAYFNKLTSTLMVYFVSIKSKLPFVNHYKSDTLGLDRLSNVMAVVKQKENCLVIDVGTCLKFDFLHYQKGYLGGLIAPGLPMRLKSMHDYTSKLPQLNYNYQHTNLFGLNTQECMINGAYNGVLNEIIGVVSSTKSQFGDKLKVFLTGGDAVFFEKDLKNNIFVDKFLTLRGINEIFRYNLR